MTSHPHRRRALSTTEVIVTLSILALLTLLSITGISRARRSRATAVCAANLHAIGIAFTSYAADYSDAFPTPTPSLQWEDQLRDYIHRDTFHCPADVELFPQLGSSYDWRDTGNPLTTLAGKSHIQVSRANAALAYDTLPAWHAPATVQVLAVDLSVTLTPEPAFFSELQLSPTVH